MNLRGQHNNKTTTTTQNVPNYNQLVGKQLRHCLSAVSGGHCRETQATSLVLVVGLGLNALRTI